MQKNVEKQGYLLEDFRLFHLNSAAGVRTENHYHEFCKVLLLLQGSGSYWIEGRHYDLKRGDVVLVGSGCVHRPEFAPGIPYERIILYISPEFLKRQSTPDCDLMACFSGSGQVLRSENASTQLLSLVQLLEEELAEPGFGHVILSSGLLLRLLVQIIRNLRQGNALSPGSQLPQSPRIRQIMAYVNAHLSEELNIDSIADELYLSKFHMMRLFRSATGMSINQYITQQRLLLARDLIQSGLAATESCFRSGFGCYSSFTRAYGKFFGMTPTGRKYNARLMDESYE